MLDRTEVAPMRVPRRHPIAPYSWRGHEERQMFRRRHVRLCLEHWTPLGEKAGPIDLPWCDEGKHHCADWIVASRRVS